MSEEIKHECGLALIRLLKPLDYYIEKYGTALYGINKLYLLMEKQHNRGQDGAGVVTIKLNSEPGKRYIARYRSNTSTPIRDIFGKIFRKYAKAERQNPSLLQDADWLKSNIGFCGELLLGHLRYGTHGKNRIETCHPFLRQNNWKSRNLVLAGNFNMTNTDEQFEYLVGLGQYPKEKSDTVTVLEKIGHFLDEENKNLFNQYKDQGCTGSEISELIFENINIQNILTQSAKTWDGGYAMAGLLGHGDAFVMRDPSGIRPVHYYADDEVVVVTSERPPIQTSFNIPIEKINEIKPGHALIIKTNGTVNEVQIKQPTERKSCSFERVYFSRGTDSDIYKERKTLGRLLVPAVMKAINNDFKNTVFSYIPNTAEVAFQGMVDGFREALSNLKNREARHSQNGDISNELKDLLTLKIRIEKICVKDVKLRTFITEDASRNDMVQHVYDVTYGVVQPNDILVILDDSIVRGTTLEQSILKILDRLGPKKIIIVSSAPQIRYPDCYGIDMSKMKDFIAFRAMIELMKETKKEALLDKVYALCKDHDYKKNPEPQNYVKELFHQYTDEEISAKISEIVKVPEINAEVQIIYQSIDNLHKACPNHTGDWYFSGNYPTPGGNKVCNKAFLNYMEGIEERAY
ncbi:MAG: amidophosphoribosyltransferase [Bacteroidetes bacterium]|nr:MAG: amidophosphoribosyltransferase [Bacteroidota bacterium]